MWFQPKFQISQVGGLSKISVYRSFYSIMCEWVVSGTKYDMACCGNVFGHTFLLEWVLVQIQNILYNTTQYDWLKQLFKSSLMYLNPNKWDEELIGSYIYSLFSIHYINISIYVKLAALHLRYLHNEEWLKACLYIFSIHINCLKLIECSLIHLMSTSCIVNYLFQSLFPLRVSAKARLK